jgi:hypothetical protein
VAGELAKVFLVQPADLALGKGNSENIPNGTFLLSWKRGPAKWC